jgi:hypothetical protein
MRRSETASAIVGQVADLLMRGRTLTCDGWPRVGAMVRPAFGGVYLVATMRDDITIDNAIDAARMFCKLVGVKAARKAVGESE